MLEGGPILIYQSLEVMVVLDLKCLRPGRAVNLFIFISLDCLFLWFSLPSSPMWIYCCNLRNVRVVVWLFFHLILFWFLVFNVDVSMSPVMILTIVLVRHWIVLILGYLYFYALQAKLF